MIKWSRVRLVFSILTAEGLWSTWLERFQIATSAPKAAEGRQTYSGMPELPKYYDYAGAVHVHSTHSDGTGTVSEIARAAAKGGLDFILLSDHNTLAAIESGEEGWHENGRVLVAVGTEFATDLGYLLAFDVPVSFVPGITDGVAAMKEIMRLGGYGFVALPLDLKDEWRDFSKVLPGIGLEVFNLSSIARTKINIPGFLLALVRYRGKHPLSAFSFVAARPNRELRLWDQLSSKNARNGEPVPLGLGSLDAHAVMRLAGRSYPYPTYEQVFRTLRTHVVVAQPLSSGRSDTSSDLRILHGALRNGQTYISYDNYGDPTGFVFELEASSGQSVPMGGTATIGDGSNDLRFVIRAPRTRTIIRLLHEGKVVASGRGGRLEFKAITPGVYRTEVYLYRYRVGALCIGAQPWIFSNPIVVKAAAVGAREETGSLRSSQGSL